MNVTKKAQKGFTLIELMIVVAIIGILAAIAFPSYQDYVKQGKLSEAMSALANGRVKMEQYYQDNHTYSPGLTPAATTNFGYALSSVGLTTYTITATGTGNISSFIYTINQANTKGSTTPWGNNATCWVRKKSGSC